MTLQDIVHDLAQHLNLTQKVAREVVLRVQTKITEGLLKDGIVRLGDLGILKVTTRRARVSRNPRTNETLLVPKKRTTRFKPAKALEDQLAKVTTFPSSPQAEVETRQDLDDARGAAERFLFDVSSGDFKNLKSISIGNRWWPLSLAEQKQQAVAPVWEALGGSFKTFSVDPWSWKLSHSGVRFMATLDGTVTRTVLLHLQREDGEWQVAHCETSTESPPLPGSRRERMAAANLRAAKPT